MRKEASAEATPRRQRRRHGTGFSLLVLLLALVGAIVAARSQEPIFWMLIWPTPLVLVFTAARFIREGFHQRDGVLVLGRAALEPAKVHAEASDAEKELSDVHAEASPVLVDSLSVFARRQNVEAGSTHGLATHGHIRKNQRRTWLYHAPYVLEKGTVN
jgi:4-amino-4-deoxy-L-arabinose transferase-like glycosyltransferase